MEAQRRQSADCRTLAARRPELTVRSRRSAPQRLPRLAGHQEHWHQEKPASLPAASSDQGLAAGPLAPGDLPQVRRRSREACSHCRRKPQGPLPERCRPALGSAQKRRPGRASRPSPPRLRHRHQRVQARFAGWRRARPRRFLGRRRATRCRAPASRTRFPRRRPALSSRLTSPHAGPLMGLRFLARQSSKPSPEDARA